MVDFLIISTRPTKNGIEVYPKFRIYPKSADLMVRGGDFYAVWDEEAGLWSTDEHKALHMIDVELDRYVKEHKEKLGDNVRVLYTWDSESGMVDAWHRYCQKQSRDSFHMLDEKLIGYDSKEEIRIRVKRMYDKKEVKESLNTLAEIAISENAIIEEYLSSRKPCIHWKSGFW